MTDNTKKLPDGLYYIGMGLVAISALVISAPLLFKMDMHNLFGFFLVNYVITITYLIVIWYKKSWHCIFPLLVLMLISAYSLNRDIPIFESTTNWLVVVLAISAVNYLLLPFIDRFNKLTRKLMGFVLGISFMVFVYLTIYLFPVYPFGIIASFFIGLSLHCFAPALFVIYTIKYARRIIKRDRSFLRSCTAGVLFSVVVVGAYSIQWGRVNRLATKLYRNTLIADNTDLPGWVALAQGLPDNWMTEKYLKGNLVYTMPSGKAFDFDFGLPTKNFEEKRQHDPLIMIAGIFSKPPEISTEDRIKVLESMYLSRHQTQDRLWNGANLYTRNIMSNIRIWPEQRLAYTEKTITVQNIGKTDSWWDKEEAIYTFHLPEGSVVTSLSLWINGKEQKGVLTGRARADSAYKQIVGIEQHDPSLVHWQEGNTVSVRVFPVLPNETRVFKVGVTTPLTKMNDKLVYENNWFEGASFTDADETKQIDWVTEPKGLAMPAEYIKNGDHRYKNEGPYNPDWKIEFTDPGIKSASFSFAGNKYEIGDYTRKRQTTDFSEVYLDINSAWTEDDLNRTLETVKGYRMHVFNETMITIDNAQSDANRKLLRALLNQRFSLFPFYSLPNPAQTLVVTKCSRVSPSLRDLKESDFAQKLGDYLGSKPPVKLFNLGPELNPYLKTLQEHRAFNYEQGNAALLQELVHNKTFATNIENDSVVVINNAGVQLTKTSGATSSENGPDHLMRLFAYNHLMSKMKKGLFATTDVDTNLVNEAEQAYIVTPVSSLIVLETQKDYDRFGIKKGSNVLDNASLKSQGAVPEPHEWALIIVCCAGLYWVYYRNRKRNTGVGA